MDRSPLLIALVAGWLGCARGEALPASQPEPGPAPTVEPARWRPQDWETFEAKVRWGVAQGLDAAPLGEAIARLGATFVGATYLPGTLDPPGPERLIVNLTELDCVTFVETVLSLTRFIRHDGVAALSDSAGARRRYEGYLREWRYRGGRLDGYPSRLHYFSEWLTDNAARGRLTLLRDGLGAVADSEPIDFMSAHVSAYRQLADGEVLAKIRATEARLDAAGPRWYVPEGRIAAIADSIHDGDVIAATSTVAGLDVAHTGIALWQNGALHLLHAPLVGKSVEISERPLAERILGIRSQDGIMVARAREP